MNEKSNSKYFVLSFPILFLLVLSLFLDLSSEAKVWGYFSREEIREKHPGFWMIANENNFH
jgi:hypothetical protein